MLRSIARFMVAKKSNLETMQNLGETLRCETIASAWHIDCIDYVFRWLAALLGKLSVLPKRRKPLWGSCGSTRPPHFRCLRSIDNRFCDGQPCAEVPQRPGRGVRLTAPAGVFLCFFICASDLAAAALRFGDALFVVIRPFSQCRSHGDVLTVTILRCRSTPVQAA